ncbi:MAG: hypothetical protein OHK0046_46400 [Anaerolineae bacterium]
MSLNGKLNKEEAAAYLGVSVHTLNKHIYLTGMLPKGEVVSQVMYWPTDVLDTFAEQLKANRPGHNMTENQITPRMFIERGLTDDIAAGAIRVTREDREIIALQLGEGGYYRATLTDGSELAVWRNAILEIEYLD